MGADILDSDAFPVYFSQLISHVGHLYVMQTFTGSGFGTPEIG